MNLSSVTTAPLPHFPVGRVGDIGDIVPGFYLYVVPAAPGECRAFVFVPNIVAITAERVR